MGYQESRGDQVRKEKPDPQYKPQQQYVEKKSYRRKNNRNESDEERDYR